MRSLALLDNDGVYGSARFHQAALKAGLKAHIGAEVMCDDGARYPLLVETRQGYQNLCRLITRMKLRAKKGEGSVSWAELEEHAAGLHCLTGDLQGPLARVVKRQPNEARQWLQRLQAVFGKGRVHLELQRHHLRREEVFNQAVIRLAELESMPLLASNGVSHALPEQHELLDVVTCIRNHVTLDEAGRLLTPNRERHLKRPDEMWDLFSDIPEALTHTVELSSQLGFTLADLGYEFPPYPVPPGETMDSLLRQLTYAGARDRFRPITEKVERQLEKELGLIEHLKLPGYFLIVWDIVDFCRKRNILVQGRGSAANSAVCYALGITAVDPIKMELLFERFLSEERGEWPDIDLDLPSGEQRELAIQYVYERYGRLGAAMTANVISYRGRSAARDVGNALGFPEERIAGLSRLTRGWEWTDPRDTVLRRFHDAGFDMHDPLVNKFIDLFSAIQDLPRHLGQHSGGMVICRGRLDTVVPLEPATMPGRVVVQWDKDDCADMGILKVDLLGLGMMAVLEESLVHIRDSYGKEVDLAHLPQDPEVYDALCAADTIGLFQVESRAQMATLPRLKPRTFHDLVVEVAIIRPGPIVGKMVHPYIRRRQGLEPVEYFHPDLKPVLERTLGLPLFQEQLLRMAMIIAGFSGGQAEELRRAFGHKRSERRMREVEVKLRAGMTGKGIEPSVQDAVVQSITGFALYGFPESHAASFALLAYASAYLKTKYLGAFTCAMLNCQPMGFYSPATLVKDAQRHGLRVLPVDITRSDVTCTLEPDGPKLRLGLNYVRGLRRSTAEAIVEERLRAPFRSVQGLVRRVPQLQQNEVRQLAAVGALNPLGKIHRREALWTAEAALRPTGSLLASIEPFAEPCPLRPMQPIERMNADYNGAGVHIGRHPMAYLRANLAGQKVLSSRELSAARNGQAVAVAGAVIVRQRPGTAKGFFFLSLEDEYGIINIIVDPDLYADQRAILTGHPFLLIRGIVQHQDGVLSVKARSAEAIATRQLAGPSHDFH